MFGLGCRASDGSATGYEVDKDHDDGDDQEDMDKPTHRGTGYQV